MDVEEEDAKTALASLRLHWSEEVKAVKSELLDEKFETIDEATRQRAEKLRSGVKDTVKRYDGSCLFDKEFMRCIDKQHEPVVLSNCEAWYGAEAQWTFDYRHSKLLPRYRNEFFKVGVTRDGEGIPITLGAFQQYMMNDCCGDLVPMYIFDDMLEMRAPVDDLLNWYTVPSTLSDDLLAYGRDNFNELGQNVTLLTRAKLQRKCVMRPAKCVCADDDVESATMSQHCAEAQLMNDVVRQRLNEREQYRRRHTRHESDAFTGYTIPHWESEPKLPETTVPHPKPPPHRWLCIGGWRSGTAIHQDPLGTSAWNALLTGHKRWCLLPPQTPASIVRFPGKEDETYSGEALTWFMHIYPRTQRDDWPAQCKPLELIQRPGDLIIVPSGWWHVVLNLDMTVAVTQNYASETNLRKVWRECCDDRPDFAMYWLRALKAHRREYAELCERECVPTDEGIEM